MRHSPAVCTTLRTVLDDVTFADYTFPAGTFISVNTFAANCDPEVYPCPDHFDITREDPPPVLTFGGGGVGEEMAVLPPRRANGADRTAVNPRRRHADEKPAVETAVSREQGLIAGVRVEVHGQTLEQMQAGLWPDPDMSIRA